MILLNNFAIKSNQRTALHLNFILELIINVKFVSHKTKVVILLLHKHANLVLKTIGMTPLNNFAIK